MADGANEGNMQTTFDPDGDGSIAAVTQTVTDDTGQSKSVATAAVEVVPAATDSGRRRGGGALGLALLLPLLGLGLARRGSAWIEGARQ
jgi:hypothetical protein